MFKQILTSILVINTHISKVKIKYEDHQNLEYQTHVERFTVFGW